MAYGAGGQGARIIARHIVTESDQEKKPLGTYKVIPHGSYNQKHIYPAIRPNKMEKLGFENWHTILKWTKQANKSELTSLRLHFMSGKNMAKFEQTIDTLTKQNV